METSAPSYSHCTLHVCIWASRLNSHGAWVLNSLLNLKYLHNKVANGMVLCSSLFFFSRVFLHQWYHDLTFLLNAEGILIIWKRDTSQWANAMRRSIRTFSNTTSTPPPPPPPPPPPLFPGIPPLLDHFRPRGVGHLTQKAFQRVGT